MFKIIAFDLDGTIADTIPMCMEYLLKKYSVYKEEFCYIGDTVRDIKDCQDIGAVCFSAAWQASSNDAILEKENPNHVFYCVNDLYEYFVCKWS